CLRQLSACSKGNTYRPNGRIAARVTHLRSGQRTEFWQSACDRIVGRREEMATIPLTEEQVAEDLLILNVANVGLSDEQFIELCCDNRELLFELTAQKELVIMTPPGPGTGRRNSTICTDLEIWSRENGGGIT